MVKVEEAERGLGFKEEGFGLEESVRLKGTAEEGIDEEGGGKVEDEEDDGGPPAWD